MSQFEYCERIEETQSALTCYALAKGNKDCADKDDLWDYILWSIRLVSEVNY
jgi:hypothetical protein